MNLSAIFSRYMARIYALNFVGLLAILLSIVYLFDTVELLRRANKRDDVPLGIVLEMGLLKLPEVGQMIFPFAILFAAMLTFWHLTRKYELIVARSAGISVWQFLAPVLGVAVLIGALQATAINPVGATFLRRFEALESRYLIREETIVTLLEGGLWLRQPLDEGQYRILHARNVKIPEWTLSGIMVLTFAENDRLLSRVDAMTARIIDRDWLLEDVVRHGEDMKAVPAQTLKIPTNMNAQEIEDSFASPETLSFWVLPEFIHMLERTGFDTTRFRLQFQVLMARPLLFASMILIAAIVSLRPPRSGHVFTFVAAGVLAGFVMFFFSSFLEALGASQQIPVWLAAWSPPLIALFSGIAILLTTEDG